MIAPLWGAEAGAWLGPRPLSPSWRRARETPRAPPFPHSTGPRRRAQEEAGKEKRKQQGLRRARQALRLCQGAGKSATPTPPPIPPQGGGICESGSELRQENSQDSKVKFPGTGGPGPHRCQATPRRVSDRRVRPLTPPQSLPPPPLCLQLGHEHHSPASAPRPALLLRTRCCYSG